MTPLLLAATLCGQSCAAPVRTYAATNYISPVAATNYAAATYQAPVALLVPAYDPYTVGIVGEAARYANKLAEQDAARKKFEGQLADVTAAVSRLTGAVQAMTAPVVASQPQPNTPEPPAPAINAGATAPSLPAAPIAGPASPTPAGASPSVGMGDRRTRFVSALKTMGCAQCHSGPASAGNFKIFDRDDLAGLTAFDLHKIEIVARTGKYRGKQMPPKGTRFSVEDLSAVLDYNNQFADQIAAAIEACKAR